MKPEFVKIGDKKYKINTDFRVAISCEEILSSSVGDKEKVLAVIYKLFGDEGLNGIDDYEKLLELGLKYLTRGVGEAKGTPKEPDMDYKQDWGYIKASFLSDYGIKIDDEDMHFYDFVDYLSGLTENAILSRVRYIRNYDTSNEKGKALAEWNKAKKIVALKKKKREIKEEQIKSSDEFLQLIGKE